jgi:hypothetical protein
MPTPLSFLFFRDNLIISSNQTVEKTDRYVFKFGGKWEFHHFIELTAGRRPYSDG